MSNTYGKDMPCLPVRWQSVQRSLFIRKKKTVLSKRQSRIMKTMEVNGWWLLWNPDTHRCLIIYSPFSHTTLCNTWRDNGLNYFMANNFFFFPYSPSYMSWACTGHILWHDLKALTYFTRQEKKREGEGGRESKGTVAKLKVRALLELCQS